jgi:beta-glucanase (GH16 family)
MDNSCGANYKSLTIILIIAIFMVIFFIFTTLYYRNKSSTSSKPDPKPNPNPTITKNIDQMTSPSDINKYKQNGMQLIYSNEMKDQTRIMNDFVFEEQPYNTLGTGTQSYVGKDLVKLTNNGLYLGVDVQQKPFDQESIDYNKWLSTKMTGRSKVRFCYGVIEAKIRCPDIVGTWPAFWLNFCSGAYGPDRDGKNMKLISYQPDHPFPCGMYWPPEIDIMERFNPALAYNKQRFEYLKSLSEFNGVLKSSYLDPDFFNQNQSSLHSPNQVGMPPVNFNNSSNNQNQWCPQGVCDSAGPKPGPSNFDDNKCSERKAGQGYCFGTSTFYRDRKSPTKEFIIYKCVWTPDRVEFYMDDEYYGSLDYRSFALYNNGSVAPVVIPSVPMFPIFNTSLLQGLNIYPVTESAGVRSKLNYDDKGNFIKDGMEIEWVRIYQDVNTGTGLNPQLTEVQKQTIMKSKSAIVKKSAVSTIEYLECTKNKNCNDTIYSNVINNVCDQLDKKNDNFCLGLDAAMVANNGGIFNNGQSLTASKTDAVLSYISDKYNLNCDEKSCYPIGYDVMPKEYINSDWYNKYGYPEVDLSPKAPCYGVQSLDGSMNLSKYKCK